MRTTCVPIVLFAILIALCRLANAADLPDLGRNAGARGVLTWDGLEYAFRWCPAGSFIMGSPESETGRDEAEVLHKVNLTQGFWILETEVTQEMYQSVMGVNPSAFRGVNMPVDTISWEEATRFCEELSSRVGAKITLPTESQWEYAARAGTTGPWSGELAALAWYGEATESGSSHAVAGKKPNAWGIYDMHGNLWEWCRDRWTDYTGEEVTDPQGSSDGYDGVRVDRGGCWDSSAEYCRSAYRGVYERNRKSRFVGFRVVTESICGGGKRLDFGESRCVTN
ncbi:MAG: formylglycine-generating enzyme family protein [Planctomycetia bacterium]|nr:formylglycine-generating enzyme family protein [Planctomycetia bacterium]